MRYIQQPIYKFSELPTDAAKQRAVDKDAKYNGYSWSHEAKASLEKLAEHFGGKLTDYSIDYFDCSYSSAEFDMPESEPEEIAYRLGDLGTFNPETLKGNGDCKLTGYCMDEDAIDGFRIAWHGGERSLDKLMEAAFRSWLKAAQADCEDQNSFESFGETADANDWEFTEKGNLFHEQITSQPR